MYFIEISIEKKMKKFCFAIFWVLCNSKFPSSRKSLKKNTSKHDGDWSHGHLSSGGTAKRFWLSLDKAFYYFSPWSCRAGQAVMLCYFQNFPPQARGFFGEKNPKLKCASSLAQGGASRASCLQFNTRPNTRGLIQSVEVCVMLISCTPCTS